MDPLLSMNDKKMFYKFLDTSIVYFEYGAGGSTYQANIRNNIRTIYSVESDIEWIYYIKQHIEYSKINFLFNDMDTQPDNFGHPGENSTASQRINYSNQMRKLSKEEQSSIDFVLIDGRFRVACCLKCFDIVEPHCLIAFDDLLNRKQYEIVLDYFNLIDKTSDNCMAILRKKKDVLSIPEDIIHKYELISE